MQSFRSPDWFPADLEYYAKKRGAQVWFLVREVNAL